eukprot:GHVS01085430.1.p1 GENE.GHVS01085430.1~~GHVS01085430.1.p1  ORF type:complete len:372 (+),score=48.95 GHVS01085430.1:1-1116(+)
MFDSGLPAITEPNILSHFIPPTSFIAKALEQVTRPTSRLLSSFTNSPQSSPSSSAVAGLVGGVLTSIVEGVKSGAGEEVLGDSTGGGSGNGVGSGISGCGSDIWWRTGTASYASNEVYVDVVESLWCSISSSGEVVVSSISGDIIVSSKLSDLPELTLSLQDPDILTEACFHPSVKLGRLKADRILSFVPPDGDSTLASYWLPDCSLKPPVKLRSEISFPAGPGQSGSICLMVSAEAVLSRTGGGGANTTPIEDVHIRMELPEFIGGATMMSSLGTAKFDVKQKELTWNLGLLEPGVHRAEGMLTFVAEEDRLEDVGCPGEARCTGEVYFSMKGWAMSGIRVDTLDVSGVNYSPYKGCRYTTLAGKVEYRL